MFGLLIAAIIPVIVLCIYVNKKDTNKEPKSMLFAMFFLGIVALFLSAFVEMPISNLFGVSEAEYLPLPKAIIYTFFGVAIVEEFFKWIMVRLFGYNSKHFDDVYDIIVYSSFVALGFACFENIVYVLDYGFGTAITRALLSVPGHLCDGIMMGYYLSMAKLAMKNNNKNISKRNLLLSLLVPTIAHGLYDYLVMAASVSSAENLFVLAFYAFIVLFFLYASKKVKQLAANAYNLNPNYIGINQRMKMAKLYKPTKVIDTDTHKNDINICPKCSKEKTGKYCSECGEKLE